MAQSRRLVSSSPSSGSAVEFRATEDDAWYSVDIRLENDFVCGADKEEDWFLRVMFPGCSDICDERISTGRFSTAEDLEEFARRFRPESKQLQDWECRSLSKGMIVCASSEFNAGLDLKFYDAIVKLVQNNHHKSVDGIENCTCVFELQWKHGPHVGSVSPRVVENICIVQDKSEGTFKILDDFLLIAKNKLGLREVFDLPLLEAGTQNPANASAQVSSDQYMDQTSKGHSCQLNKSIDLDIGLGGSYFPEVSIRNESSYYIVIENMEKDILPEIIVHFIHRETLVLCELIVFPGLYSESYSRGVIFVHKRKETIILSEFLHNSAYFIVSSSGRPWVIANKQWHYGSIMCSPSNFQGHPQIEATHKNSLTLARKGTKQYEKAKQLYALSLEFHTHVQRLHQARAAKERKIISIDD